MSGTSITTGIQHHLDFVLIRIVYLEALMCCTKVRLLRPCSADRLRSATHSPVSPNNGPLNLIITGLYPSVNQRYHARGRTKREVPPVIQRGSFDSQRD